jgi:hypothetical protein
LTPGIFDIIESAEKYRFDPWCGPLDLSNQLRCPAADFRIENDDVRLLVRENLIEIVGMCGVPNQPNRFRLVHKLLQAEPKKIVVG